MHATDGPKSRKLHLGEFVVKYARLPSFPRIKARFQRAALEPFGVSFFHIFLHDKKDMAAGGTGSFAKYQVGKNVILKSFTPEGTSSQLTNQAGKYV